MFLLRPIIMLLPAFFLVAPASALDLVACEKHEDCQDTPHPICGAIALPGFPPKVCMSSALLRAKSGSNEFEIIQEQFVSKYLTELVELRPYLDDGTLAEIAFILTNERPSPDVSLQQVQARLRKAYDAIAAMDAVDRMLLSRYVKRRSATTLQRELVIVKDIVENPDLLDPKGLAAIEQQIRAEEKRLEKFGLSEPGSDDFSGQMKVIGRLHLKKAEFEYRTELQEIRASNLTPQKRRRQYELAKYGYELKKSAWYGIYLGQEVPVPKPPSSTASPKPRKITFELYAVDKPGTGAVADVAGVPPVATAKWPPRDTMGKAVLQQTERKQRKGQEGKTWKELRELEEKRSESARAQYDRDAKKAERQCQAVREQRSAQREMIMVDLGNRIKELRKQMDRNLTKIDEMKIGVFEKKRLRKERNGPLYKEVQRLKRQKDDEDSKFNASSEAASEQCARRHKAAQKRYQQNIDAIANAIKGHRTPDSGEQPTRQLPMYEELTKYDEPNRGPTFQDPAVQWYMRYIADTLAKGFVNGLLIYKNVPVKLPPISPKVAGHLLKVKDVESDYGKACWAAGLYRLSILAPDVPVGNTGKSLSNLMHDLINFPRPGSPSRTCKYLK